MCAAVVWFWLPVCVYVVCLSCRYVVVVVSVCFFKGWLCDVCCMMCVVVVRCVFVGL